MVEDACPECGGVFEVVWKVTVGTNMQGYTPVFGRSPVVVDAGRCNACNISYERIDGGPWSRQGSQ